MRRMTRERVNSPLMFAVLCALLLAFTSLSANAQSTGSSLLVKLAAGLSPAQQAEVIARNGGIEISSIPALRLHVIQVAPADLPQILARYQADPQVVNAEENKTRQSQAFPADPLYPNQWSLPKIGWDLVFGTVTPTGSAIVAVLDTGVDAQHPDLAYRFSTAPRERLIRAGTARGWPASRRRRRTPSRGSPASPMPACGSCP